MNTILDKPKVLPTVIKVVHQIALNSLDSVQSSKEGLILAQKHNFEDMVWMHVPSAIGVVWTRQVTVPVFHSISCLTLLTFASPLHMALP